MGEATNFRTGNPSCTNANALTGNTDYDLIMAHKAGNSTAFARLITRYKSRVYNHCQKLVRDEAEIQDLGQEIFIKAFRAIDKYEPSHSFYTWLYRITANCCIDHLRKRGHAPAFVSLSEGSSSVSFFHGEREIPDHRLNPEVISQSQ